MIQLTLLIRNAKTNTFQFYIIVYSSIQKRCTHFNAGSYLIPITIKEAYRGSDEQESKYLVHIIYIFSRFYQSNFWKIRSFLKLGRIKRAFGNGKSTLYELYIMFPDENKNIYMIYTMMMLFIWIFQTTSIFNCH